jgi:hypothetical protein
MPFKPCSIQGSQWGSLAVWDSSQSSALATTRSFTNFFTQCCHTEDTSLPWYIFLSSPHQEARHSSGVNTLLSIGTSLSHPLNNKFSYPWLGYHCGVSTWFQQLYHQHDMSPFMSAEKYILTPPSSWITVLWHLQYVIFRIDLRQWTNTGAQLLTPPDTIPRISHYFTSSNDSLLGRRHNGNTPI